MRNLGQSMPRLGLTLFILYASHLVSPISSQCKETMEEHHGCRVYRFESENTNSACSLFIFPRNNSHKHDADSIQQNAFLTYRDNYYHIKQLTHDDDCSPVMTDDIIKINCGSDPHIFLRDIQGSVFYTYCNFHHLNTIGPSPYTLSSWTYIMIGIVVGAAISCTGFIVHKMWHNHRNKAGPQSPEQPGSVDQSASMEPANGAQMLPRSDDHVYDDIEDIAKHVHQKHYFSANEVHRVQPHPSDDGYLEPIMFVTPCYENLSYPLTMSRQK